MVLPDGTQEKPPANDHKRGVGFLAGALAVLLLGGLFALTTPPDQADPTPTTLQQIIETPTTASPYDPYILGEPLELNQIAAFHSLWPVSMVSHNGRLLAFGSAEIGPDDVPLGLILRDVLADTEASTVIGTDFEVRSVVGNGRRLIAVGSEVTTRATWVWESEDGVSWTGQALDSGNSPSGGGYLVPDIEVEGGVAAIVVYRGLGETRLDVGLAEYFGVERLRYGWGEFGSDTLIVYGPLGLTVAQVDVAYLGLTRADIQATYEQQGSTDVWLNRGEGWLLTRSDELSIESVWLADEEVFAVAYSETGSVVAKLEDGRNWVVVEDLASSSVWNVSRWTNGFLGNLDGSPAISEDGLEWRRMLLARLLPGSDAWDYHPLTGSESGIALLASSGFNYDWEPEPFELTRSGYTLSMNRDSSSLEIHRGEALISTTRVWGYNTPAPDLEVDLIGETVTFNHPETAEPLMTVTFDELDAADRYVPSSTMEPAEAHLMFSEDATTWRVAPAIPHSPFWWDRSVIFHGSEVIVMTTTVNDFQYPPTQPALVEVWAASIEEG